MRILISNDDGIRSEGIEALVRSLYREHEVVVAAPAGQQSAKAHAITVRDRLYVEEYRPLQDRYGIQALAIDGTPADTVKLYIEGIIRRDRALMPELVISGINDGSNLGTDMLYSGTIGAASEGFVQGIDAVAVSLEYNAEHSFEFVAEQFAGKLPELLGHSSGRKLLNVNFPRKLSGSYDWVWCRQGVRDYCNAYERQQDEAGRVFYTVGGSPLLAGNTDDTDVMVTCRGNISVTPLQLDKTDFSALPSGRNL
ncbi:5'/3'-nucleotidase SurE [Anaerovibrio sp.]|uniref:5'/3'-nucleotidase SurE n=1 Tax=Anaerovibrio sp. TaxID=1872532 RepID=UPI003F1382E1